MQTFYTFNKYDQEPHIALWAEKSYEWSSSGFVIKDDLHDICQIDRFRLDFNYTIGTNFFGIWIRQPEEQATIEVADVKLVVIPEGDKKSKLEIYLGDTLETETDIYWYDSTKIFLYFYNDLDGLFNVGAFKYAERIGNMYSTRTLLQTPHRNILLRRIILDSVDLLAMGSFGEELILLEEIQERAGALLSRNRKDESKPGGAYTRITGIDSSVGLINIELEDEGLGSGALEKVSGLEVPTDIPFFLGGYEPYGTSDIVPCIGVSKLSGANLFINPDRIRSHPDLTGLFHFNGIPGYYPMVADSSGIGSFGAMYPLQEPKFYKYLPNGGVSIGKATDGSYPQETTKYSASFSGVATWLDDVTVQTTFSINSIEGNQLDTTTELIYLIESFGLSVALVPPSSPVLSEDHYGIQVETSYPYRVTRKYSFASSIIYDRNRWENIEDNASITTYMRAITRDEFTQYLLRPTNWVVQAGATALDGSPGVRIYINDELFLEIAYKTQTPKFFLGGNLALGRGLMDFTIWSYSLYKDIVNHRELVSGIPTIGWISPVFSIPAGLDGKDSVYLTSILPEEGAGYTLKYRTGETAPSGDPVKTVENGGITYEVYEPGAWTGAPEWTNIPNVSAGEEIPTPVYLQYVISYENWRDSE